MAVSPPEPPQAAEGEAEASDVSAQGSVWRDEQLAEAIALFQAGNFQEAQALALDSIAATRPLMNDEDEDEDCENPGETSQMGANKPESTNVASWQADTWRVALDDLATAHEDAGDPERAEALYLRMLAWREGTQQFRQGHFGVAEQLFKKSPDYRTVEDATWFLQSLRPDDGHAVPEVVALLALGEEVAAKAAVALWTLALRPQQRPKITECGGLELVAKAVAYHVENAELQAAGCGALRLLCTGHSLAQRNRKALVMRLGGVEALCAALRCHCSDPEVQREACGAMRAASVKHPAGARRFLDQGAIGLCLNAIAECPDEAVGEAACQALDALQCAPDAFEAVAQTRLRAEREAGLRFCEEQFRRHLPARDLTVLQGLLGATAIFFQDCNVRHRALSLIEHVIACMQAFPGQKKIQLGACNNLLLLTSDHHAKEEAVAKIAKLGGVAPVVVAMQGLPTNPEVQLVTIAVLRNLTRSSNENKTLGIKAGAVLAIINAMNRFPKDARLQEEAIGALTNLCDHLGRSLVAARQGVLEAVLAAIKRHIDTGRVAELGLVMFCMFCDDEKLRHHVSKSGILPIAKTLSRKGQGEAQRWASELLQELSDGHRIH